MLNAQEKKRWNKLSMDQLQGAMYAYRLLRTSPRIRGAALELLDWQIQAVDERITELATEPDEVDPPMKAEAGKDRPC
jgi:hypothetical protein